MKPTMCAELSAHAQIGAVLEQRRLDERLCRAAEYALHALRRSHAG
jgi:hypothetical protein